MPNFGSTHPDRITRERNSISSLTPLSPLVEAEIEAMKVARRDAWIAVVTAPPVEEPEQDYIEIDGVRYAKVAE